MQERRRQGKKQDEFTTASPGSASIPIATGDTASTTHSRHASIQQTSREKSDERQVVNPRLKPRPRARYSPEHRILLDLLIEARKASGISQKALSQRLNKSLSHISFIESNDRDLTFVEVARICAIIGLPLTELIQKFEEGVQKSGGYVITTDSQADT